MPNPNPMPITYYYHIGIGSFKKKGSKISNNTKYGLKLHTIKMNRQMLASLKWSKTLDLYLIHPKC